MRLIPYFLRLPGFLELPVPFDQPLQVLLVDGIVKSLFLHGTRKRPSKQERQGNNECCDYFEHDLDRRKNHRHKDRDPERDFESITLGAFVKTLKYLSHDPDAGGW
jgi:hypothetical protein